MDTAHLPLSQTPLSLTPTPLAPPAPISSSHRSVSAHHPNKYPRPQPLTLGQSKHRRVFDAYREEGGGGGFQVEDTTTEFVHLERVFPSSLLSSSSTLTHNDFDSSSQDASTRSHSLVTTPSSSPTQSNLVSTSPRPREIHAELSASYLNELILDVEMKDRRSLQSLFVPSFLQSPPTVRSPQDSNDTPISPIARLSAIPDILPLTTGIKRRKRAQTHSGGTPTINALAGDWSSVGPGVLPPSTPVTQEIVNNNNIDPVAGRSSPSAFLLDDDPFANLTSPAPTPQSSSANLLYIPEIGASSSAPLISPAPPSPLNPLPRPTSRSTPTSPTSVDVEQQVGRPVLRPQIPSHSIPSHPSTVHSPPPRLTPVIPVSPPTLPQRPYARPAYTRPAFRPRPSLPSLSTLARMDMPISTLSNMFGMPVKVKKRKGRVGAGLPLEPWDTPSPLVSPLQSPGPESTSTLSVADMDAHITPNEDNAVVSSSILYDANESATEVFQISECFGPNDGSPATLTELSEEQKGNDDHREEQPLLLPVEQPSSSITPTLELEHKVFLYPESDDSHSGAAVQVDVADANENSSSSQMRLRLPLITATNSIEVREVHDEADIYVVQNPRHGNVSLAVELASPADIPPFSSKAISIARSRRAQSTPSPSYSPLMTAEELGVYLSASPSFPNALRTQTRPDSLAIDPHLPSSSDRSHLEEVGNPGDVASETSSSTNEERPETELFPAEQGDDDDGSSLPPLSTPAELDPVFSLSPPRSQSLSGSSSRHRNSHSRPETPESGDRSLYGEGIRPLSFGSVQGEMPGYSRHVSESSYESSLGDELSLTLYETSPYDSFDNIKAADEGPLAPRASRLSDLSAELDKAFSFERMVGWEPFDKKGAGFEPGSSAGTLRPQDRAIHCGRAVSNADELENWFESDQGVDISSDAMEQHVRTYTGNFSYSNGRGGGSRQNGNNASSYGQGANQDSSESDYGEERGGGGWNRGGSGGRDGRDDGRDGSRDRRRSAFSTPPSSADSSDDDSTSSDDYGADDNTVSIGASPTSAARDQRRNGQKGVYVPPTESRPMSKADDSEDDDVPLAQRLPNALVAQKSIRRQQRDERQQRRLERAATKNAYSYAAPEQERGRTTTLRGPAIASWAATGFMSSSQEAALLAQRSTQQVPTEGTTRARSRTIGQSSGVAPDDLARRLLMLQQQDSEQPSPLSPSPGTSTMRLPPQRSDTADTVRGTPGVTNHSATMATSSFARHGEYESTNVRRNRTPAPVSREPAPSLRPMRSFHGTISPASPSVAPPMPVRSPMDSYAPPPPSYHSRTTSTRSKRSDDANVMGEQDRIRPVRSRLPSIDAGRPSRSQRVSTEESSLPPPVPPLPTTARTPQHSSPPAGTTLRLSQPSNSNTSQLRVFLGSLQRFNMIEVGPDTTAKDVLATLEKQGEIRREAGWMVWEICQDFGVERPIRNYELLFDVSSSWDKDKSQNMFMVKKTTLAGPLASIPSSSPLFSGPVEWEAKKGKWSKRWLELREHGLFVSKREGKGEEFLCSLSTFDAYVVSRIHKSPKPFVFAVKSTDPITLFENKSDYLHVFCCSEEGGRKWMENILLAKSYILYQERHVLFPRKESAGALPSASLSRSGTRKRSKSLAQPFVAPTPSFFPPTPAAQHSFEPGSLLARRTTDAPR